MLVLVTGATAGFGAAIARAYVRRGDRVIATGRRRERLDALRAELGPALHPVELDVRDRAAVARVLGGLPPEWSAIDVLVNNAGLAIGLDPAQTSDLDEWEDVIDTNVKGATYVLHAVLPGMVARGRGHLVHMSSVAADIPYPGGNVYGASKAYLSQLSRNLRSDLLGTPIRVTHIDPGLCGGTEFSTVRFRGDQARADQVYAGTQPLLPEDIAQAVVLVTTLPPHVNVNGMQLMPVCQAFAGTSVHRG